MFMGATVFEIAGGLVDPPPVYKVWALKGLVKEGLKLVVQTTETLKISDRTFI